MLLVSLTDIFKAFLQREAEQVAPKAILRQLRRSPTPPLESPEDQEDDESQTETAHTRERTLSSASDGSAKPIINLLKRQKSDSLNSRGPWKEPQVRAICIDVSKGRLTSARPTAL